MSRVQTESSEARERRLAAAREYSRKNADWIRVYKKEWAHDNASHIAERNQDYYKENADTIKLRAKQWRLANPDRRYENNKKWALANPDKQRLSELKSKRKRREIPQVRLFKSVSELIRLSLRGRKNGVRWEGLVGFTRDDLVDHIERQFTNGMSWANYGKWHIDHIVPAAHFRYEGPQDDEFKACWALTNLRPLWAAENIRKRDKRIYLV